MPINVGDLLREKERLQGVIEEAKIARSRIKQINVLVTMYGDAENVPVATPVQAKYVKCPKCGKEVKQRGLTVHDKQMHGKMTAAQRKARAAKGHAANRLRAVG